MEHWMFHCLIGTGSVLRFRCQQPRNEANHVFRGAGRESIASDFCVSNFEKRLDICEVAVWRRSTQHIYQCAANTPKIKNVQHNCFWANIEAFFRPVGEFSLVKFSAEKSWQTQWQINSLTKKLSNSLRWNLQTISLLFFAWNEFYKSQVFPCCSLMSGSDCETLFRRACSPGIADVEPSLKFSWSLPNVRFTAVFAMYRIWGHVVIGAQTRSSSLGLINVRALTTDSKIANFRTAIFIKQNVGAWKEKLLKKRINLILNFVILLMSRWIMPRPWMNANPSKIW